VRGTRIVIGALSSIDSFVKFKPAGGSGDVVIGERTTINSGCVLYTAMAFASVMMWRSRQTALCASQSCVSG
jgi:hypothetical protein